MSDAWLGIPVTFSTLAVRAHTWHAVEPHPTPKRRRRWTVRRHCELQPAVIQTPQGFLVHPSLRLSLEALTRRAIP